MPPPTATARAGRPPKVVSPVLWNLRVSRPDRTRAQARAQREGRDLTDVMRALLSGYASGRIKLPAHRDEVPS